MVKSKSMLTEECHLNPFLERHGIEVIDTDLGERIVQLAGESPSHIVLPAIHVKKEEVGDLFHEHLGTRKRRHRSEVSRRGGAAHLRENSSPPRPASPGVNFAVAETGGLVICTNEGNADLGVSLAKLHIACMGIEKLVPRAADLAVFLRLLARSATGQPITTYSSHFHGPMAGGELHIVLVDNGRSDIVGSDDFRALPQLHSLRRMYEYLSRLSPQRRAQLWHDRAGADRLDPGAGAGRRDVCGTAIRMQPVRIVHRRLSGEDRHPSPTIDAATRNCRKRLFALDEAARHAFGNRGFPASLALSHDGTSQPLVPPIRASFFGLQSP